MKRILKKIVNYQVFSISNQLKAQHKLDDHIKIEATKKTARYILENCPDAAIFTSKELLYDFIVEKDLIKDQYFEFGVWKANSINFFSSKFTKAKFYGFDSFEGLPENWRPGFDKGEFSLEGKLPLVNENVTLISGWFKDSLPNFLKEVLIDSNLFLHIDCDLYSSTKDVFDHLGNKLKGTVYILFDEYFNYPFWEHHEFRAFQEFIKDSGYQYEYVAINIDHEQVLLKVKI